MNDLLKQRILRRLESLSDDRGFQVLDYVEFLESKYAERQSPNNIFARITETVEDTMRAGKIPIKAISGTMNLMDSAGKLMKGLSAAGKAVVDEAVRATEGAPPDDRSRSVPPAPASQPSLPPADRAKPAG
ncbi:MAG: hypothetical protein ABI613_04715, partial [Gemmatimonadota bacterium]